MRRVGGMRGVPRDDRAVCLFVHGEAEQVLARRNKRVGGLCLALRLPVGVFALPEAASRPVPLLPASPSKERPEPRPKA